MSTAELNCKVELDKGQIKIGSDLIVLTEDQVISLRTLAKKRPTRTKVSTSSIAYTENPTHIRSNSHYIEFCAINDNTFFRENFEGTDPKYPYSKVREDMFHTIFKFDLVTGFLLDSEGEKLNCKNMKQDKKQYWVFTTDKQQNDNYWMIPFLEYLYEKAYFRGSFQNRSKMFYLFEEAKRYLSRTQAAEKTFKAYPNMSLRLYKQFDHKSPAATVEEHLGITSVLLSYLVQLDPYISVPITHSLTKQRLCNYTNLSLCYRRLTADFVKSLEKSDYFLDLLISMSYSTPFSDSLNLLVQTRQYDLKRLLDYLFHDLPHYQGYAETHRALELLVDYAAMVTSIYGSIKEKYPKHLKTDHDIAVYQFNALAENLQDQGFMLAYTLRDYSYAGEITTTLSMQDAKGIKNDKGSTQVSIQIETPACGKDLVKEGKIMHHCVGSYVETIRKNPRRAVVFVRGKRRCGYRTITDHLATVELNENEVRQIKGKYNQKPIALAYEIVHKYAEDKGFIFPEEFMQEWEAQKQEELETEIIYRTNEGED